LSVIRYATPRWSRKWRAGPHGATADCVACHGERHGALPAARTDGACTGATMAPSRPATRPSKHGVLVRIGRPDWTQPLERGRHRAPGCAYCHLHDRDHGDAMDASAGRRSGSGCAAAATRRASCASSSMPANG